MKKISILLLYTLPLLVAAQKEEVPAYDWEESRQLYVLDAGEQHPEYILKLHRSYHYRWEEDNLIAYQTDHRITRVNTTNAIERHNRIYILMRNVMAIVKLKARAINKDGKVTNFDQTNLKEIKDDKTDDTYRIFAIEGIEAGSEIEYFYVLKTKGKTQESYYFQQETPIRDFSFELLSPKALAFDFRLYNDGGQIVKDTLNGFNHYTFREQVIAGVHEEPFTFVNAYRKRIEFKLAYNFTRSSARLNTWADAGRSFYRSITAGRVEAAPELEKFIRSLKDNTRKPLVERIKSAEDGIKGQIRVNNNSADPALNNLKEILASRQASSEGITKVMFLTFERLGIPIELVVTCDRKYAKFDGGFDTWAYLDEYLLYFPDTGGFVAPDDFELRYPLIPQTLCGQQGLFIEPVSVANLRTGISWVRDIPALPHTSDADNLDIDVSFNEDMSGNGVNHKRRFLGYDAASLAPYYNAMSQVEKQKFVEGIFRSSIPDLKLDKWTVNTGTKDQLPWMELTTSYQTNYFIERAGSRILFKAGELIGTQSELYSEEIRRLPVENTHNRGYERTIRLRIPKGYQVNNLDALKMHVTYDEAEAAPFSFISNYTFDGSDVVVKIEEYYKELYAPLTRYEDFRKVINAAADFNKVVLVLTKK